MRLCAGGVKCVGARGAETDSHWNTGIEFTPLLVICWVFPRFSHGEYTSDFGIQRGNRTVRSIQSGDIQTGITGREIQGAGGDQQIAPLNVCIAQAHTVLIERVLKRVCWDLEQHNTSTWFGSYLRNR